MQIPLANPGAFEEECQKKTTCSTGCHALLQRKCPTGHTASPHTDLHCVWVSIPVRPPRRRLGPKGRGYYHHQLRCPIPHHHHLSHSSLISQPCCTSDLIKNSHTQTVTAVKAHFFPAWHLLSQGYIMPVPCMAGPVPGWWQCSLLSPEEETVQTSQLCSSVPHAGPVHPWPLIPSEEVSGFE